MKTINKKEKLAAYLTAAMLFTFGCAEKHEQVIIEKGPSSSQQMLEGQSYWENSSQRMTDTTNVQTKSLTEQGYAVVEQKMRETSLNSLNLPSHLNVNAFTIKSKSNIKTKDAIYIAPKLYLYRKSDKAHVQVKQMGDKVLIPLHAILVDGFSRQIPSANGIDKVDLPESYLIKPEEIRKALNERGYSDSTSFGPLDGCPKNFTLNVAGETYDITPKGLAESNQCELNRPFTLNLIVPKDRADFIVNEALYYNEVDVQATFEVMVGYVEADTRIQLDRSKVFEKLQASLSAQRPPYVKGTVEANLKRIIQSETMNIFIKGDRNDIVSQLFQAAYDSFVMPWELTPSTSSSTPECTNTAVCVNISYEKNIENRNLEVSYQQYSTTLTGQLISSFAKAQQILFPEIAFQSQTDNGKIEYVSNLTNTSRDLLITVNRGSIIEIYLENAKYQLDNTLVSVSVQNSNYCGSRDWTKRCEWHMHQTRVSRSYSGVTFTEPFVPAGNMPGSVGDELFLSIRSPNGSVSQCSFSQLNAIGNGNHYMIKLDNTSTCKAFSTDDDNKQTQYALTFINKLRHPVKLKQINDGKAFTISQLYEQKNADPAYDAAPLGGTTPLAIQEVDREIHLKLRMAIRKYDISK